MRRGASRARSAISRDSGRLRQYRLRHLRPHRGRIEARRIEDVGVVRAPELLQRVIRRRSAREAPGVKLSAAPVPMRAAVGGEDRPAHRGEAAREERRGALHHQVRRLEPGDIRRARSGLARDRPKADERLHLVRRAPDGARHVVQRGARRDRWPVRGDAARRRSAATARGRGDSSVGDRDGTPPGRRAAGSVRTRGERSSVAARGRVGGQPVEHALRRVRRLPVHRLGWRPTGEQPTRAPRQPSKPAVEANDSHGGSELAAQRGALDREEVELIAPRDAARGDPRDPEASRASGRPGRRTAARGGASPAAARDRRAGAGATAASRRCARRCGRRCRGSAAARPIGAVDVHRKAVAVAQRPRQLGVDLQLEVRAIPAW